MTPLSGGTLSEADKARRTNRPGRVSRDGVWLEAGRVTRDVAFVRRQHFVPAGAGFVDAFVARGVEAVARDRHVGVAGVGVDGDPAAFAFFAPALERAGGERAGEEPAAVEGVGDRARAVVAGGGEAGVAAAVDVGAEAGLVGRGDHGLDPGRRFGRRGQFAPDEQLRFRGGGAEFAFGGAQPTEVAGGRGSGRSDGKGG